MMGAHSRLGFNASWSMAVGGMVGGGIFSTLGVVIGIAGRLAWLSFAAAGLVALAAGYSYAALTKHYRESGGAFTFLRRIGARGSAGSLAWVLIAGYVLTNAVYAFTFGQYLGHVAGLGDGFARACAIGIMAVFTGLNLREAREAGGVEVVLVWFKLAALAALAGFGLARWDPQLLARGAPESGIGTALFGAAAVFMAYEGFQLLAYDYDDIADPDRTLPRAVMSAIAAVILLYVAVAVGTPMLIGADQVIAHKEVALALAGREAFGATGVAVMTVAAAFSTGSAINATLFSTARLSQEVTRGGELPAPLAHENRRGVPDRAVIGLGALAAVLAATGTLSALVEAASLAFLFTFSVVCGLAFRARAGRRVVSAFGALAGAAATIGLVARLALEEPLALILLGVLCLAAIFLRPWLLRRAGMRQGRPP